MSRSWSFISVRVRGAVCAQLLSVRDDLWGFGGKDGDKNIKDPAAIIIITLSTASREAAAVSPRRHGFIQTLSEENWFHFELISTFAQDHQAIRLELQHLSYTDLFFKMRVWDYRFEGQAAESRLTAVSFHILEDFLFLCSASVNVILILLTLEGH